jgi:hypothetical protein
MDLMRRRKLLYAAIVVALGASSAGAFLLGRHSGGWNDGYALGYDAGVPVGRALQAGVSLPAGTRDVAKKAFQAGYQSGLADSFGGYDGGWILGRPYVVVIAKGAGDVPYRIDHREPLRPGVWYRVCENGADVCAR